MHKVPLIKMIGCIMIVTGTVIGAGILALPIITAQLGFMVSTIVMLISWCVMTYTALLIADIVCAMPKGTSFATLARRTLGVPGAVISWLSFLVLMYLISIAYISAASSSFSAAFGLLSQHTWAVLFVIVFSTVVIAGTRSVDWLNRILIVAKLVLLLLVCFVFLPYVEVQNLLEKPMLLGTSLIIAIPVIVTSFTSHIITPTLSDYLDKNAKALFWVIVWGSVIPLILYFLWLMSVLGVLPLHGSISFMSTVFNHATPETANVGDILQAVELKVPTSLATYTINIFTFISVMTSYLMVSLSLYHFNIDSYRLYKLKRLPRFIIAAAITFAVPLAINLINPNLFIGAISYVGVCIAILLMIMPGLMSIKLKYKHNHQFNYALSEISLFWYTAIVSGALIIAIRFI